MSFDYAAKIGIPIFADQTQGQYFAEQFNYDIQLFGIVDERTGKQHNFVCGEGSIHAESNAVISQVKHLFFTPTNQISSHTYQSD